ncbi:MAG TPA: KGG domain-containing protein [Gemmatimonadaceae bacterium]|nr:KGG domain-containing protein [Gemmatimonadaceae bacterium]
MAERSDRDLTSVGDERQRDSASVSRSAASANGGARASSGRSNRGFASMDPQRQKEIASKGGRAAHAKGTAHEWTSDEARNAGRKGGETVSRDRAHMAAIGREGGGARSARNRQLREGQSSSSNGDSMQSQSSQGGSSFGGSSNS